MGKLEKLKSEIGANAAESSGGPSTRRPAPAAAAGPANRPARMVGVQRSKDAALIELTRIAPDPDQPRKEFDPEELGRMAESLKKEGQLQPIRVRWAGPQSIYYIITGERRWRGAQLAGLTELACVIDDRTLTPGELLKLQMIENVVRADLKPIEQANAIRSLMRSEGWSGNQLAKELGLSQSRVVKALALLKLDASVQESVDRGELPAHSAYPIARLEDPALQREVAARVITEKLNDKQATEEVRRVAQRPRPGQSADAKPGKGKAKSRGLDKPRETSRVFNHYRIKILAESRQGWGIFPSDLLEALRNAADLVESELRAAGT